MNENNTLPSNIDIINVLKNSNLTPSQKVSVITEINNKSQPSKNLSHVPCKFFRQGACQAGNSCPFSHATDVSLDSQPCKYFQKGNCKFGIKCALAHVLPDGRKVNTKNLQNSYQSNHHQNHSHNHNQHHNQNQNQNHHYHQQHQHQQNQQDSSNGNNGNNNSNNKTSSSDSSPSDIINTVEPISINGYYNNTSQNLNQLYASNQAGNQQQQAMNYNNTYNYNFGNNSNPNSHQNYNYNGAFVPSTSSVQISSTAPATSQTSSMATSPFNGVSIWSNSPSSQLANGGNNNTSNNINNGGGITNGGSASNLSAQAQFVRSISFSNPANTSMRMTNSVNTTNNINSISSNPNSSFSHSFNQSFGSPSQQFFTSPISSANTQNYSAIVDSAILDSEDDNDDENDPTSLGRESEDVDFVPSSLNDLLTPQELKRRHSRSSFGSQHPVIAMSSVKDPYNLIEEDTPFIMD